jgi:C_GCAxxG_C_C family probable redox protein
VLLVIEELFDLKSDDALKAATAFGGGIGRMGSACGALIGGAMALSLLYGRTYEDMQKGYRSSTEKEVNNLPGRCCRHSLPQPPGHDKGCRQNKF